MSLGLPPAQEGGSMLIQLTNMLPSYPTPHTCIYLYRFEKSDYDIKRTLGVGAYGFVKLVRWNKAPPNQTEVYYALKCVSKEKIIEKKQQHKIKREEDIMKSLVHPFIARCYNVSEDARGKYFCMEALCGGELCELLYFEDKFSEDWSMFYSASVLAAFAHMHERKVAYRDLKPENLVLDNAGYVKIVDFGLAKVIKNGQTYTFCGTPDYLAPEVILSEGHDWAVDYWGLGVLIYEMTEGAAPFYAENPMDVRMNDILFAVSYISWTCLTLLTPIFVRLIEKLYRVRYKFPITSLLRLPTLSENCCTRINPNALEEPSGELQQLCVTVGLLILIG